jgi:hypothetical protein
MRQELLTSPREISIPKLSKKEVSYTHIYIYIYIYTFRTCMTSPAEQEGPSVVHSQFKELAIPCGV